MNKFAVVLYKNQPAVVNDRDGDKYIIKFCTQPATPGGKKAVYGEQKVREKDVVLIHEGPCKSLEVVLGFTAAEFASQLDETYELLLSDEAASCGEISLSEIAERSGFLDYSYFSKIFKKYIGITPIKYRQKFL